MKYELKMGDRVRIKVPVAESFKHRHSHGTLLTREQAKKRLGEEHRVLGAPEMVWVLWDSDGAVTSLPYYCLELLPTQELANAAGQ